MRRRDFIRRMGAAVIGVGMLGSELLARGPKGEVWSYTWESYHTHIELGPELQGLTLDNRSLQQALNQMKKQMVEAVRQDIDRQILGTFRKGEPT